MATFDLLSFGEGTISGGLSQGLISAFGLPTCILEISDQILALLPTPILATIMEASRKFREEVDRIKNQILKDIATFFNLEQYFGPDGKITVGIVGLSALTLDTLAKIQALVELGMDAYAAILDIIDFIEDVKKCIDQVIRALGRGDTTSAEAVTLERIGFDLNLAQNKLTDLEDLDNRFNELERKIIAEVGARANDPNREIKLKPEYRDRFGAGFQYAEEEDEDLIRLVYGPPISKDGQFILSVDGLYYDSQSDDGVFPVLIQLRDREAALDKSTKWLLNYDPNLGGKGEQVSSKTFNKWLGSIFDLNIIDNSKDLETHYKKDSFLQNLIGQRDKRLLDLKKEVDELTSTGASQAVINNFKQGLVSETTQLQTKVDRRKKQIEVAVKAPTIFGYGQAFEPGFVPINDFSYLQKYNITTALPQQKNLIINTESIDGLVKPITPKFTKTKSTQVYETIDPLLVPDIGYDAVIDSASSVYLDDPAPRLNIDELVSTDGLFGLYNFLNSDVVVPSSLEMNLNNCYAFDSTNNAQIVAKTSKEFFVDLGLAAPYFKGIVEYVNSKPQNLGSYVKLPDTSEFQDWTYNKASGFSFESWVYMPTLEDSEIGWKDNGVSSLYRLILANENTGKALQADREEPYTLTPYENGTNYVKGMIFGFTTDRRWTTREMPSNDASLQDVSNGYGLLLAPTLSYDSSSATFIATPECDGTNGWRGMFIPSTKETASGKKLSQCNDEYTLLSFSVDYKKDTVTVFLDSEVLETSSVSEVFGSRKYDSIQIPSFKKPNSFEYSEREVGSQANKLIKNGPKLNKFFTPWILGGGYTDGNLKGGFMGGEYGGLISGLRGFLGSVKFYNKSITQAAVNLNYRVQEKLFKKLKWARTVILAFGQSNMAGNIVDLSGMNSIYHTFDSQTKIWDPFANTNAGAWVTLDPSVYNNTTRYGVGESPPGFARDGNSLVTLPKACPILVFAKNYETLHKQNSSIKSDIYFIKNASDGTYMFSGFGLPSDPNDIENVVFNTFKGELSAGSWGVFPDEDQYGEIPFSELSGYNMYPTLRHDLSAATRQIPKPFEVKAVLCIQGESDGLADSTPFFPADTTTTLTVNGETFYLSSLAGVESRNWAGSFTKLYGRITDDIRLFTSSTEEPVWILGKPQIELPDYGDPRAIDPANNERRLFSFHYTDAVRSQLDLVSEAIPNVFVVNNDGLTLIRESHRGSLYTGIHFDGKGLEKVGLNLFNKFKEVKGFD